MRESQKVPLCLDSDLKLVKSLSAHKLYAETFHSHDWTGLHIFTHNPTGPCSQSVLAAGEGSGLRLSLLHRSRYHVCSVSERGQQVMKP